MFGIPTKSDDMSVNGCASLKKKKTTVNECITALDWNSRSKL